MDLALYKINIIIIIISIIIIIIKKVLYVACFRYTFCIDVDHNVLKNLILISRCFELDGERNITASIAIDLQSMIEDTHAGFTRDELSYMLNNVCTTRQLTCN